MFSLIRLQGLFFVLMLWSVSLIAVSENFSDAVASVEPKEIELGKKKITSKEIASLLLDDPTCELIKTLLEEGYSPLDLAVMGDSVPLCEKLLSLGADIKALNKFGLSSLYYANDANVIDLLLERGATFTREMANQKNEAGDSLLAEAVKFNRFARVKMLCSFGADVNEQDSWGWTPLMYAAYPGFVTRFAGALARVFLFPFSLLVSNCDDSPQVITCLLENGANPLLKNKTTGVFFHDEYSDKMTGESYALFARAVEVAEQEGEFKILSYSK